MSKGRTPRGAGDAVITRVAHRVASHPAVYDAIQRTVGTPRTRELLRHHLAEADGKTVLDVGAGTGRFRDTLPAGAKYIWLDNDPQKLAGFKAKRPDDETILADATTIPLGDKSVDYAFCVAVAHHLPEDAFARLVSELARVVRERLLFMDPIRAEGAVPRLLWRFDRGTYPCSAEELLAALRGRFDVEDVERYAKRHRYVFCVAAPKAM
jgi:SAM-dependent methyltransferase